MKTPALLVVLPALVAACTAQIGAPTGATGDEPTTSAPADRPAGAPRPAPVPAPTRRLRRLSSREYNNVVRDLLGDGSRPADRFLADAYQNGYDNGSVGLAVQEDQVVDYQAAAEALAATATEGDLARLIGSCDPDRQGPACADAFFAGFVPRAFRRPPTATELQRLRDVFAAGAATEGGFRVGLRTALEAVLQSPQFLYRSELGAGEGASGATVALTEHEVASELSFLLTGSMPDPTLWAAVERGQFRTTADHRREALRVLGTPAARETLRAFLHRWMATDRLATLSKDPQVYPSFDRATAASMAAELDGFFDRVLWQGTGSLRELFLTNDSVIDPNMARLYGMTAAGPGMQPVALDPQRRKGILTRAGYLAAHAAADSSGPVARGVFLLQAVLCQPPPPPPADVPPLASAETTSTRPLTTRQRFDAHLSNPSCRACHQLIDGLGYGFEAYDGIGAYRTTDNGQPIDSHGTVAGTGEIDGDYEGVGELAERLAGSRRLAECFVRQAYRYGMGEIEPATLESVGGGFSAQARITDLFLNLVASPAFVTRAFE
jgi:hypothetical protein